MRSTGDLGAAAREHPLWLHDGLVLATALALPEAMAAFSTSEGWVENHFFEIFDRVCMELRAS